MYIFTWVLGYMKKEKFYFLLTTIQVQYYKPILPFIFNEIPKDF